MYFIKFQVSLFQARRGQLNFAAVYFGVLQRQIAAFSGQHLRQWRITITTMTGIGLTGASAGEEGKKPRIRGAVEHTSERAWREQAGLCVWAQFCGSSSECRPRSSSALPLWWMEAGHETQPTWASCLEADSAFHCPWMLCEAFLLIYLYWISLMILKFLFYWCDSVF